MKIKTTPNQTVVSQLTNIVNSTLPRFASTGLSKDLGVVKNDPKSKGKSILFNWRKGIFRLSETLKVTEQDFTNAFIETDTSRETEAIIKSAVSGVISEPQIAQTKEEVKELCTILR